MKTVYIILSFLFLIGCAVKKVKKVTEIEEQKKECTIKNDSIDSREVQLVNDDIKRYSEHNSSLSSLLNFSYDGERGDSTKATIKKVKDGIEVSVYGKGKFNFGEAKNQYKQTDSLHQKNYLTYQDLQQTQQNKSEKQNNKLKKQHVQKDKFKFDFSFWVYVVVGSVALLALGIILRKAKGD